MAPRAKAKRFTISDQRKTPALRRRTRSSSTSAPFFILPAEIRVIVYKLLLVPEEKALLRRPSELKSHHEGHNAYRSIALPQFVPNLIPISILQTSKVVYEEAAPVLYKFNTFHYSINGHRKWDREITVQERHLWEQEKWLLSPQLAMMENLSLDYCKAPHTPERGSEDSQESANSDLHYCIHNLLVHATSLKTLTLATLVFEIYMDDRFHSAMTITKRPAALLKQLFRERLVEFTWITWGQEGVSKTDLAALLGRVVWKRENFEEWSGPTLGRGMGDFRDFQYNITFGRAPYAYWRFETVKGK